MIYYLVQYCVLFGKDRRRLPIAKIAPILGAHKNNFVDRHQGDILLKE